MHAAVLVLVPERVEINVEVAETPTYEALKARYLPQDSFIEKQCLNPLYIFDPARYEQIFRPSLSSTPRVPGRKVAALMRPEPGETIATANERVRMQGLRPCYPEEREAFMHAMSHRWPPGLKVIDTGSYVEEMKDFSFAAYMLFDRGHFVLSGFVEPFPLQEDDILLYIEDERE